MAREGERAAAQLPAGPAVTWRYRWDVALCMTYAVGLIAFPALGILFALLDWPAASIVMFTLGFADYVSGMWVVRAALDRMDDYEGERVDESMPVERTYWKIDLGAEYEQERGVRVERKEDANCVSSLLKGDGEWQAPALDLDVPHTYVPSSTPGHGHLLIDVAMEPATWRKLMEALGEAGILESGYVESALRRGHSELRLPGVEKKPGDRKA